MLGFYRHEIRVFMLCSVLLLPCKQIYCQIQTAPSSDYDRNAMTLLLFDYSSSQYSRLVRDAFKEAKIPVKFDEHNLQYMNLSERTQGSSNLTSGSTLTNVQNIIKSSHIPNDIIAKWYSRDEEGKFGMSLIAKRGLYNATDQEYAEAMKGMRKNAQLEDAGEKLVNKSYIMVMDYYNLKTMKEIYDAQDEQRRKQAKKDKTKFEPVERKKNGFVGDARAYLFKIDFNDSIAAIFYRQLWIDERDSEANITQKKKKFEEMDFPVKLVSSHSTSVEGTQYNPGQFMAPVVQKTREQLMAELINDGINGNIFWFEKQVADWRVRTMVHDVHPISAKIGRKENLKVDQRFFVYENRLTHNNKEIAKRVGVIRAKYVADNRNVTHGNTKPSVFYQVAGRKIDNYGMYIEQKNDLGIGIIGGYSSGAFTGGLLRLELGLAQLAGNSVGYNALPSALRLYIEAGLESAMYDLQLGIFKEETDYSFAHITGGLSKDLYFFRNFHITPYAAFAYETASWKDEDNGNDEDPPSLETYGASFGGRFGFNLLHNLQIIYSVDYFKPVGSIMDTDDVLQLPDTEMGWVDVFEGRSGISQGIGIRLQF